MPYLLDSAKIQIKSEYNQIWVKKSLTSPLNFFYVVILSSQYHQISH